MISRVLTPSTRVARFTAWLERPLSDFWCLLSWVGSSILFFVTVGVLGGPTEGDSAESVYSTWAVAHGDFACAYPPGHFHPNGIADPFSLMAPLYPLVTGFMSFVLRLGHTAAFPSAARLGPHCGTAFKAMYAWSVKASVILPTVRLSYCVWPLLLVGTVLLLRVSGRGRRGWECVTVFVIALTFPTTMCVVDFFHPEDVLAMGLLLISLALVLRQRWVWAGVFIGLAIATQQFALLAAAPLFIVAPAKDRYRYLAATVGAAAIIDVPMIVATSGRAIKTVLLGSSRAGSAIRSTGGSVLWEANLHGALLFFVSRLMPLVGAVGLAWWITHRRKLPVSRPDVLLSLVATSLSLRLVFEVNLFGYYFMAIAVMVVLVEVVRGRLRSEAIAWLGLVTLAFNPVHWGFFSNWTSWEEPLFYALPIAVLAVMLVSMVVDATRHTVRLYKVLWLILVLLTCESKVLGRSNSLFSVPHWIWQLILVPTAIGLVIGPLLHAEARPTDVPLLDQPAGVGCQSV